VVSSDRGAPQLARSQERTVNVSQTGCVDVQLELRSVNEKGPSPVRRDSWILTNVGARHRELVDLPLNGRN
jgi:hypothetical protein